MFARTDIRAAQSPGGCWRWNAACPILPLEHNLAKVGVEGSNPFARSKNLQTVVKPSLLPSPTVDSSVCYTKLLHNGHGRLGAKRLNCRDNRQNFCYTKLLHNSRGGLFRRGGWFYFRRRVPDALRTVLGRSEIWVSLKTANEGVASMRGRTVAAAVEGEFARAWADNAPSTLPMVGTRNAAMLKLITSTVSARLSERHARVGPNVIRRARFWIPLIGLFSGLRLNEICQLDLADILLLDGVLCFTITSGTSESQSQKRVKNLASERIVPVHAELRRCGFENYITERRKNDGAKLFPELKIGSTGYHSKAMSQWFIRTLPPTATERSAQEQLSEPGRDAV